MFLKELELINFMCYDYLKLPLHGSIITIHGRNGSGKSALLSAINLIFGGLSRERQDLLRNFIRHGREVAIIRARISNVIPLPGRGLVVLDSDEPLDSDIIIERVITHENSYYKLNGKRITRERLIEFLLKVNISPKNTFYFIPQEKITKLVDLKPEERLDSLLISLGLYDLKDSIDKLRLKLKEHLEKKKELEGKISDLREKIESYKRTLKSAQESLRVLKNFYVLKVSQLYKRLDMIAEEEKRLAQLRADAEAKMRDNETFIKNVPRMFEKLDLEAESLRKRREEVNRKISEYEEEERKINEKIKTITSKLSSLSARRDELMKSFREVLDRWGVRSIEDLKSLLEDKRARLEDLERAIDRFEEGRQIRELEIAIQRKKKELSDLESIEKDYLTKLEEILKEIDPSGEVLRLYNFIQKPSLINECFGPIMLEIDFRIPQDRLPEYSKALERILRENVMRSFVVISLRALRSILQFIKDRGILNIPSVYFFSRAHAAIHTEESLAFSLDRSIDYIAETYENFKRELMRMLERNPEYKNAFLVLVPDIISAPRPVLAIIRFFLGKVALVGRLEAGLELLGRLDLDGIITIEGDFVKKLKFGDYAIFQVLPPLKGEENLIVSKIIQFNIKDARKRRQKFLELAEQIKEEISTLRRELENLRENVPKNLRNMLEERARLMESIIELEGDIRLLDKIQKERESLPDHIQDLEKQLEELDENLRRVVNEKQKLEKELQDIDFGVAEIEQGKESLLKEKARLELENEDLKNKLAETEARLTVLEEKKNSIISEVEKIKKEIKAFLAIVRASFYSDSKKDLEEILKEEIIDPATRLISNFDLNQIEELLSKYSEQDVSSLRYDILSREEKIRLLEESLEKLENYRKELQCVESEIESARKLAEKSLYELLRELREKVSKLSENYRYVLSKIGATGEIKIEGETLENLKLLITIDLHRQQPLDIGRGAFSSGEKTLAIFAFLMALFLTAPAPILLLDEFDVYLDEITVRKVSQLLREVINDMKSVQVIMTTTRRLVLIEIADEIVQLMYDEEKKASYAHKINKKLLENVVKSKSGIGII